MYKVVFGFSRWVVLSFALVISVHSGTFSQMSENHRYEQVLFREGLDLMERKNYGAAREIFEKYLNEKPGEGMVAEASYYRAFCAINLYHEDGEQLFRNFIRTYPAHPKANQAYHDLAGFYYKEKDYKKASEYYEKVNISSLSESKKQELKFRKGYSWFHSKNDSAALENFRQVVMVSSPYQAAAAYYAGFIELKKKNYNASLNYLTSAGKDKSYAELVPSLVIQVYSGQENYRRVIVYGDSVLNVSPNVREKDQIYLILADAYYQQKEYEKALGYFSDYFAVFKGNAGHDVLLKAGISAYFSGYEIDAIEFLRKAALAEGITGQYASYFLGHSYLKENNISYATAAFHAARSSTPDKKIREEATFYYGQSSYAGGNYADAVSAFSEYLSTYSNGEHREEAQDLLGESYLNSENYDQAIQYIESIRNPSARIREVYQKVAYLKGTSLYNSGHYPEAVTWFQKSLQYQVNREITLSSYFWMGETYSIGSRYDQAITAYSGVFRNDASGGSEPYLNSRYGIGYAYYNSKQYDKALDHFKAYTDRLRRENRNLFFTDALLRLADCYYATKNYTQAISIYQEANMAGNPEKDYCFYQLGVVYGIQSNLSMAFRNLDIVIEQFPGSVYYDDALFRKAQLTFENGDYETAISRFGNLISAEPQSQFIPYALVSRAIAAFNLKDYSRTIADYKQMIVEYSRHPMANSALLGLQEALTAANREDEFSEYLEIYKKANPEAKELASVELEAAKTMYFNQKYHTSIQMLENYVDTYPSSPLLEEVYYYLGDSYLRNDQPLDGRDSFLKVLEYPGSKWYNRSLQKLADIELNEGNAGQAVIYYKNLEKLASNKKEEWNAWEGLMESYYNSGKYDSAVQYSRNILEKGGSTAGSLNKAHLFSGKSFVLTGKEEEALDHFLAAVNDAKDVYGAEAQYLIAEIFRKRGEYVKSNETLFNLNQNFAGYEFWIGQSFLMMADNFISMGELFQARATLNSVIEKSPVVSVVEEAKNKLLSIREIDNVKDTIK